MRVHRRSIDEPHHAHELTFSCYQRRPFLRSERTCLWLVEAINEARERLGFLLWAYVFMPEHAHLLVFPNSTKSKISEVLRCIKQPVGFKAIQFIERHAPEFLSQVTRQRGQRTERLFWQSGGGYDRNITEPRALLAVIEYIHQNPGRRGLVNRPEEWRWSSASSYLSGEPRDLAVDPIPPEWTD
jgi:putative transposase